MVTIIIIGIVEALIGGGALFFLQKRSQSDQQTKSGEIEKELQWRLALKEQVLAIYGSMVGWQVLRDMFNDLTDTKELLKIERGRVTITQAELETVENRLRELDEVDREFQASSLETKEELRILNKKEKDLRNKNDQLKSKIQESISKFDELLGKLESNSQAAMQVESMKSELLRAEQKVDELLLQIEQGNEQYFILKQVYDALDIEYAQLYEKFSEANPGS